MSRATSPIQRPKSHHIKFPCFIGFYVTEAQRQKLEQIARETHRGLGETMRLLVDSAHCTVVDLDLTTPAPISPTDAA